MLNMAKKTNEGSMLRFLYGNVLGRICLRILIAPWISKLCGAFLNSRLSKPLIKGFVKNNNIDLSEFESDDFRCFNDCFCRKIKEGLRPLPEDENALFSPCDGLLSAYKISDDTIIPVKQSEYSISSLLKNEELAERYRNGICLVFRLCVNHYHRYSYPATGTKSDNVFIKGKLHTVRPIALRATPVFTENSREYTVIKTEKFGDILQMEVGAMLVGKIKNHHGVAEVKRGEEKGMFLFGGSTVILLFEKDKVQISKDLFSSTAKGLETPVLLGEALFEEQIMNAI